MKDSIADVSSEEAKVAQDLARQKYFYPDMYGKQNCVFDSDYEDWMMGEVRNTFTIILLIHCMLILTYILISSTLVIFHLHAERCSLSLRDS